VPIFVARHPANAVGYITPPLLPIHFFVLTWRADVVLYNLTIAVRDLNGERKGKCSYVNNITK